MAMISKNPPAMPASKTVLDSTNMRVESGNSGPSYRVSSLTIAEDKKITCEEMYAALDALAVELNENRG